MRNLFTTTYTDNIQHGGFVPASYLTQEETVDIVDNDIDNVVLLNNDNIKN